MEMSDQREALQVENSNVYLAKSRFDDVDLSNAVIQEAKLEWGFKGHRHRDGQDPEGNVIPLRRRETPGASIL